MGEFLGKWNSDLDHLEVKGKPFNCSEQTERPAKVISIYPDSSWNIMELHCFIRFMLGLLISPSDMLNSQYG